MKVPAFADIGKEAKELLYGGRSSGLYQYDTKFTANMKTTHAVDFALTALKKDTHLSMDTKATIKNGPANLEIIASSPKVTGTFSQVVLEGLKVSFSATAPDIQATGKMTLDYAHPYFTGKAACSLNKSPVVDLAAAAGYNGLFVGGDTSIDVVKSAIAKWSAAVSFVGAEFVVAAHLLDGGNTLKATYHQKVDAASSIGAEVVQNVNTKKIDVVLGYSNTSLNGDIRKVKIANDGTAHCLYEFKPRPEITTAVSMQVNTVDMSAPKVGFAVEYNP